MWAIGVHFLTGTCVATDPSDRESPEWPPHPMRLFMAMAATYFETKGNQEQRAALEWFERLPPPRLLASAASIRSVVTTFVPVNDGKGAESLGNFRSRQPRTFPTVVPKADCIYYVWDGEDQCETYRAALATILGNVSRLGHSSSMVQAWLIDDASNLEAGSLDVWEAVETATGGKPMRRVFPGALARLEAAYNEDAIAAHAELSGQVAAAKGKAKKRLKEELDARFSGVTPRTQRPESRLTTVYRCAGRSGETLVRTEFDDHLLVLAQHDGPVLSSETTLRTSYALRRAILSQFGCEDEIPEWVSGHAPDGSPSESAHLAILPLPYVDAPYADGHLLGMALAFPRSVPLPERGKLLGRLLHDPLTGEDRPVVLRLGKLGEVTLRPETRSAAPIALRSETWTVATPSRLWATATPIVLDRYPKAKRDMRGRWLEEVSDIVTAACARIGLPKPNDIAINHNAFLRGVPRARPQGGGFPAYPDKNGTGARYMVHACISFTEPVQGPVILGAGRYFGYGLCKPFETRGTDRG